MRGVDENTIFLGKYDRIIITDCLSRTKNLNQLTGDFDGLESKEREIRD